jgi:hypothetical protein
MPLLPRTSAGRSSINAAHVTPNSLSSIMLGLFINTYAKGIFANHRSETLTYKNVAVHFRTTEITIAIDGS